MNKELINLIKRELATAKDFAVSDSEDLHYKRGYIQALEKIFSLIRLNEIKKSIENEDISYGEIAELQNLSEFIPEDDITLKEWAGIPETEDINVGDGEHNVFMAIPEDIGGSK